MSREALKKVRHLLKVVGWVGPAIEPWCLSRGPGVRFNPDSPDHPFQGVWLPTQRYFTLDVQDEGLERYSVRGACIAAGADFDDLAQTFAPDDLQQWLQQPGRRPEDVLRVLTSAVLRSPRESRT